MKIVQSMTIGCAFVWCSHYHPKPRLTSPSKPIAKVTMPGQWGICAGRRCHVFTASDLCGHGVAEAVRREDYWKNMFQQINQSLETLKYISLYIRKFILSSRRWPHFDTAAVCYRCTAISIDGKYPTGQRKNLLESWIMTHDLLECLIKPTFQSLSHR
jgi:hypothetical protein